jgi:hypothetical protein
VIVTLWHLGKHHPLNFTELERHVHWWKHAFSVQIEQYCGKVINSSVMEFAGSVWISITF